MRGYLEGVFPDNIGIGRFDNFLGGIELDLIAINFADHIHRGLALAEAF